MNPSTKSIVWTVVAFIILVSQVGAGADAINAPDWVRLLGFGVVGLLALRLALSAWRLATGLPRVARAIGWDYRALGADVSDYGLRRFPFSAVRTGPVAHVLWGEWKGRPGQIFLLGDSRPNRGPFWIELLSLPTALPGLDLIPRAYKGLGPERGDDIRMESADFDATWRVMGRDTRFAHAVLHPRMMELLLRAGGDAAPLTIDGHSIYRWHHASSRKAPALIDQLTFLSEVIDQIPAHVWKQYGGAPERDPEPALTTEAPRTPEPAASGSEPLAVTSPFLVSGRERNALARYAVYFSLTFFLAWIGIIFGHRALAAVRRGEANNRGTAVVGLVLSYATTALVATPFVLMALGYEV